MSELGLTPDEIVTILAQNQLTGYFFVAGLALAVYDTLLAFPQELKCIWQRKFSMASILYLLIRYGTFFNIFLRVFAGFYIYPNVTSCKAGVYIGYIVDISCRLAYATFDCLRVWGITQHQWSSTFIVFLLSMFDPAVNIYNVSIPATFHMVLSGPLKGCLPVPDKDVYIYLSVITRTISIASDAAVLVITLSTTWGIFKAGQQLRTQTSITTVLIQNGSIQFCTLLLLNVVAMILDLLSVTNLKSNSSQDETLFIVIQEIFNSIVLSHFILNLRSIYHIDSKPSFDQHSTVHFATFIEGNMGTSLSTSWIDGNNRDAENEAIQYSDNPLMTGLLDTGDQTDIEFVSTSHSTFI